MFLGATYFKRRLCQDAWIHSKAKETAMFAGTFGTIARTVCTITGTIPAFSPQSRAELKSALDSYLERAPNGDDCFTATRAAFDIGAESAINDRFLCKAACLRCTTVTHLLSTVRSRAGSGATKMLVAKILKRDDGPPQIQKILFQGMTETALRYHMRETDNIIPDDVLVSNVRYLWAEFYHHSHYKTFPISVHAFIRRSGAECTDFGRFQTKGWSTWCHRLCSRGHSSLSKSSQWSRVHRKGPESNRHSRGDHIAGHTHARTHTHTNYAQIYLVLLSTYHCSVFCLPSLSPHSTWKPTTPGFSTWKVSWATAQPPLPMRCSTLGQHPLRKSFLGIPAPAPSRFAMTEMRCLAARWAPSRRSRLSWRFRPGRPSPAPRPIPPPWNTAGSCARSWRRRSDPRQVCAEESWSKRSLP